jgi:hypothetical protein
MSYFSMEIAVRSEMHTYGGGLGILAGDAARSCAALEPPVVFIAPLGRAGYFLQQIDVDGRQIERSDWWNPPRWCVPHSTSSIVVASRRMRLNQETFHTSLQRFAKVVYSRPIRRSRRGTIASPMSCLSGSSLISSIWAGCYVNGVARRHAQTTEHLFPRYRIHASRWRLSGGRFPGHRWAEWNCHFRDHVRRSGTAIRSISRIVRAQ